MDVHIGIWIVFLAGLTRLQAQTPPPASQAPLNKQYTIGCGSSLFTALEVTDSCYYLSGVAIDSATHCSIGALWVKMNLEGAIVQQHILSDTNTRYDVWEPALHTDRDGGLIVAGDAIDTSTVQATLIKYTTEGDVQWVRTYGNQSQHPDVWLRTDDFEIAADGSYLHTGQIFEGYQIMQIERNGAVRWHQQIRSPNHEDYVGQRMWLENDGVVVSYYSSNAHQIWSNYTFQIHLEKYDYQGHLLWQWESDSTQQLLGGPDLIKTKDNHYLIGTALHREIPYGGGYNTTFTGRNMLFKLNPQGQVVWERVVQTLGAAPDAGFTKLLELPDSSIMAFGYITDSLTINGRALTHQNVLMVKFAPNGDSLWAQHYHYLRGHYAQHRLYDVELDRHGNFVAVGESSVGSGPVQKGWLLRLDQYGCLQPGCHLPSTIDVTEAERPAFTLQLYPNPTRDFLQINYHNPQQGQLLEWRIWDMQGRQVRFLESPVFHNEPYLMEVADLHPGAYILEVLQDGQPVGRAKFLKQ